MLAAAALLPLAPDLRVGCAAAAGALILIVLVARFRIHGARKPDPSTEQTYARIARIRAQRRRRR